MYIGGLVIFDGWEMVVWRVSYYDWDFWWYFKVFGMVKFKFFNDEVVDLFCYLFYCVLVWFDGVVSRFKMIKDDGKFVVVGGIDNGLNGL